MRKNIIDLFDIKKNLVHYIYNDLKMAFFSRIKVLIPGSYVINVGTPLYNILRQPSDTQLLQL